MSSAIHDAILGSLTISQCDSVQFNPNIEVTAARASGAVDASGHYITSGGPEGSWTTTDLATLFGSGGVSPSAGLWISGSNIDLPWSRRADGSTRAGTLAHTRLRGSMGLVVASRITASQGAPFATADFGVGLLSSNGQALPYSTTIDQTLASQTIKDSFRLGSAYITIGATPYEVPGVTAITVNTGVEIEFRKVRGDVYPRMAFIKARNPTIEVDFDEEEFLATIGAFSGITACSVFFRKMALGSTVVGEGEDEHISFSFADGIVTSQGISGSGQETAQPKLLITGEALTYSVTATFPA